MKVCGLALIALFGALGVALGMGYGYGAYQYVPVNPGFGARGGFNDSTFLMLIGFLFIFFILLNSNLFNTTSSSTTTTTTGVTVIQG